MGPKPKKRSASYEDLLAVPEHLVAEIIDGDLVTSPRPAARHALATTRLGTELDARFGRRGGGGPGGWVILDEPELHIAGQVLVPDLAGWRRTIMPEVPDVAFFELAPNWVCEIVSPSTVARDRTRKADHYADAGIDYLWFVDPMARVIETLQLVDGRWQRIASHAGDALVRLPPFEAIELDLGVLWDLPR